MAKALGQLEYAFAKERAAIWKQKALEELTLRQKTPQPPKPSSAPKTTPAPKPKTVKPPEGWLPGLHDWDQNNPKPWQDFGKPKLPQDLVDPIKDLSPKELAKVAKTGKMPKRLEAQIEHARIPQRVAKELVKAGVPVEDAIRLSKLTDKSNLLPTHREFHAVVDQYAKKKGPYAVLDERKRLPLGSATKEEIAAIEAALKKPGVDLDSEAGKKLSGWVKDAQDRWKGPDPTPPSGAAPSPAPTHGHGPPAPAAKDLPAVPKAGAEPVATKTAPLAPDLPAVPKTGAEPVPTNTAPLAPDLPAVPKTGAAPVPTKTAPVAPDLPSAAVPKVADVPVSTGSHTPHPRLDVPSPHGPQPTKGGRFKGGGKLAALVAGGTYAATGDIGAALQTLNPAANTTDAILRGADGLEIAGAVAKDVVSLTPTGAIVTTAWDLTAPRGGFPQNPALTRQALDAGRNPFCEQCHGPGGLLDTAAAERRRLTELHFQVLNEEDAPSLTPRDVTQFHQLHKSRTDAEQDALREYIERLQKVPR